MTNFKWIFLLILRDWVKTELCPNNYDMKFYSVKCDILAVCQLFFFFKVKEIPNSQNLKYNVMIDVFWCPQLVHIVYVDFL